MAVDTAEAQTSADTQTVEDRLAAHFAGKPAERSSPEPQPEPPASETTDDAEDAEVTDEVTPDDVPADDESDDEQTEAKEPDEFEIAWNGQPVKIPTEKVKDYVQQGYHLERARETVVAELTQAQTSARQITEAVGAIEKTSPELRSIRTRMQAMEMLVAAQGLTPENILAVARQDPARAQEMQAEFNVRVNEFNQMGRQAAALEAQLKTQREHVDQESMQAELNLLTRINPNMKDPVQREKARTMLAEQMDKWRPESVKAAMNNAEVLDLLIDGAKYRTLQKTKKASVEKAAKAPQVLRPGSASSVVQGKSAREQKLRARLKTTGSTDDFAELLLSKGFK